MSTWEAAADWHGDDLFATVETSDGARGGIASVWSLRQRQRVARYPVRWDAGGHRLAMAVDGVITAAYDRGRITCYDALTGGERWQGKVSTPQQVQVSQGVVLVPGEKDLRLFRTKDGEFMGRVPSLKHVAAEPGGHGFAAEYAGKGRPIRCYRSVSERAWSKPAGHWLSGVWSSSGPLLTFPRYYNIENGEAPGGEVWCLDPGNGAMLWAWHAPADTHVVATGYREQRREFVGLLYHLESHSPVRYELLVWSSQGDVQARCPLPNGNPRAFAAACAFFNRGEWLVSAAGYVLEVGTGEVLWRFDAPDA